MKNKELIITKHFSKNFKRLPGDIRELVYQKLDLFMENPKHPSLRVKRIKGTSLIWEMSITMNYRITLEDREKEIVLREIGTHDILKNP